MTGKLKIILICGGTFVAIAVLVLVLVLVLKDSGDEVSQKMIDAELSLVAGEDQEAFDSRSLSSPVYNNGDNSECRKVVDSYYKDALSSVESSQETKNELDEYNVKVLEAQSAQGIQLVNNAEFEAWTVSDWDQSYAAQWPYYVRDKVNYQAPVETSEDVERVVSEVFWWRVGLGLEDAKIFRRQLDIPQYDPKIFEMCSPETQALGVKYTESLQENCCSNRDDYFPFYEAILDWMKNDGTIVAEVESSPEVDYVDGPVPVLVFHPNDNAECKAVISSSFDSAKSSLAFAKQIKYTLNRKYYDVLTAQESNILQLANNAEFEAWTVSDWDSDAPAAEWTDEVRESVNQTPIEAARDVKRAIYALFWWRESYGMENPKIYRRQLDAPYFPAERYEMCTEQTQGLGAIYDEFQLEHCCENGDDYYPFIDRIIDWIKEQPIPEPVYNDGDNSECREIVDSYHKIADSSLASVHRLQSKLDEKYEKVLAAQSAKRIQLANNAEFEAWTVSDWGQSEYEYEQDPNASAPQWPDDVRDKVNQAPVETSEDVERVVYAVFWWRVGLDLEDVILYRRQLDVRSFNPEEFQTCSEETQALGVKYAGVRLENCCDDSDEYFPFLERLVTWMEEQPQND